MMNIKVEQKTLELIAFVILAVLVVVSACNPTGFSSPILGVVFAEALPAPPVKCQHDLQCDTGMFCRSIGGGVCSNCVDCPKMHKLPPPNNVCAKGSSEYGGCEIGYKLVGDHCTDEDDESFGNQGSGIPKKIQKVEEAVEAKDSDNNYLSTWLFAILSLIGIIALVFVIGHLVSCTKGKINTRGRRASLPGSGENGLVEEDQIDGIISQAPTAPLLPEEYNQPPSTNQAYGMAVPSQNSKSMQQFVPPMVMQLLGERHLQIPHHRIVNTVSVCAVPFNAGNAAGDWINQVVQHVPNEQEIEPPVEPLQVVDEENNEIPVAHPNDVIPVVPVEIEMANIDVEDVENVLPMVDGDLDEDLDVDEAVPAAGYYPIDQINNGNEMGEIFFYLDLDFGFRLEPNGAPHVRARSHSAPIEMDDTCMDLAALVTANTSQASSQMSMAFSSTDSGTGTSNEDDNLPSTSPTNYHLVPNLSQEVQSPSASLNNNDSGLSLYDDESVFPEMDEAMLGEEE